MRLYHITNENKYASVGHERDWFSTERERGAFISKLYNLPFLFL
jgi:hypothetical protein